MNVGIAVANVLRLMSRNGVLAPSPESIESAQAAGLRYVSDHEKGIRRKRHGEKFTYIGPSGKAVKDEQTLVRIRALAIPPAWENVWICPFSNGHLQATGIDARGRKQYRYHARWRETRDQAKYDRMIAFAHALPDIRRRVVRDLSLPGLPREKVLATVVRLLETTLIRVGNDEYAKANDSYGLTTMRDDHVAVRGGKVRFEFRGKSGKDHSIDLHDQRLAKIIRKCQDLPGQELFAYLDDQGNVRDVRSEDVNEYLRQIAGEEFTAKDFRTWAGTVLAAMALRELKGFTSQKQAKRNIVDAVEAVATKLGNTKAVCRKCYIHPTILDAYLEGSLIDTLQQKIGRKLGDVRGLDASEISVLSMLQDRLGREKRRRAKVA